MLFVSFDCLLHICMIVTNLQLKKKIMHMFYLRSLCSSSCSWLEFCSSSEELVSPSTWLSMRSRVMNNSNSMLTFACLVFLVSKCLHTQAGTHIHTYLYTHTLYTHSQSLTFTDSQACHLGGALNLSYQSGAIIRCPGLLLISLSLTLL